MIHATGSNAVIDDVAQAPSPVHSRGRLCHISFRAIDHLHLKLTLLVPDSIAEGDEAVNGYSYR
jgi:hypothetical protein